MRDADVTDVRACVSAPLPPSAALPLCKRGNVMSPLQRGTAAKRQGVAHTRPSGSSKSLISWLHRVDVLRTDGQFLASFLGNRVRVFYTDAPQSGIKDFWFYRQHYTGLQRRFEFRSDHRDLVQLQPNAMSDEAYLVFSSPHKVRCERRLSDPLENA